MKTVLKFLLVTIAALIVVSTAPVAFASVNPFVDVPVGNWAYDAVDQLAARGIVTGYEDGTFKGNQPASRYEMASVVARLLAFVDLEKASAEDVEVLKQLALEFNDELKLLGVKNDQLDSRLQVLEENLGGWRIGGQLNFYADFAGNDNSVYDVNSNTSFKFDKAELYFSRYIDDKVSFYGILANDKDRSSDLSELYWKNFYVNVNLPYDVEAKIGRFSIDWNTLYTDQDPWFLNGEKDGFLFSKRLNTNFVTEAYVSQQSFDDRNMSDLFDGNSDVLTYGAKLGFDAERFGASLQYHNWDFTDAVGFGTNDDISAYAVTGYFNVYRSVKAFGEYWTQNLNGTWVLNQVDNPDAYKLGFYVGQDMLKLTDLWVEYSHWDRGFILQNDPYAVYDADVVFAVNRTNLGFDNDTTAWYVKLEQKWTDKWWTFGRYVQVEQDNVANQKVNNWTLGVRHWYSPNISFEISYDNIDFDNVGRDQDDHLIRFKTAVNF